MLLILKHIEIEGPGTLGDFFKNSDWKLETIELNRPYSSYLADPLSER